MIARKEGVSKALEDAMKLEVEGYDLYNKLAEEAVTEDGSHIFKYLSNEEARHYRTIEQLYEQELFEEYTEFISRYKGDYMESGVFTEFRFKEIKEGEAEAALDYAIGVEEKSIGLYESLAEQEFYPDVASVFNILADEERSHYDLLTKKKDDLF